MSFMSQIEVTTPRIAVFGVGGAGGNGVADLIGEDLPNVALIAANTDAQALRGLGVHDQLQLGRTATQGLGAGAWPEVGRAAAQEVVADIEAALDGVDFCFIAAGMGGGTGTGAAPIFAECAKKRGIPTVAVVTRPFEFEGARRAARADQGIALLEPLVDAIIVVPNQRLLGIGDLDMTFRSAMQASNGVLADAVGGIAHLLVTPGLKQIGFAEMRNIISGMGRAVIGFGEGADGPDRAVVAAENAMACPLIDDEIAGAGKLMISISGGTDMSLMELDAIVEAIAARAAPEVELAWGASVSDALDGIVRVALIAQGSRPAERPQAVPAPAAARPAPIPAMLGGLADGHAPIPARPPVRPAPILAEPIAASVAAAAPRPAGIFAPVAERPASAPQERMADAAPAFVAAPVSAAPVSGPVTAIGAADLTDRLIQPPSELPPLLDLIDRLPPCPTFEEKAASAASAEPIAINLQACSMDELWLGDFEMEDPRRLSLADKVGQAVTELIRSIGLRFGRGRHRHLPYHRRAALPV
jgi:cell division protein FtsZ